MKVNIAVLASLAQVLKTKVSVTTYNDYEKIKDVADAYEHHYQAFHAKHIEGKNTKNAKVSEVINKAWNDHEVEFKGVFTKEELHAKLDGMPMSFDERNILETYLIKK